MSDRSKRRLEPLSKTVEPHGTRVKQLLEVVAIRPYSQSMTEALDTATASLIRALNDISDDVERYEAAEDLKTRIELEVKAVKADIAKSLYEGRSWAAVGKLLGVTGSRAEQISRGAR